MRKATCPNCRKKELIPWKFDLGYGIDVQSMHCTKCKFNVTNPKVLENAVQQLGEMMSKTVKVINVGEGLGIRLPKEFALYYKVKKGMRVLIKPEKDAIRILL